MKSLFVIHYPVFGGPHNQALRLTEPLRRRGWDTLVLLPDEPGNAAARLQGGGVPVVQMPLHRLRARRDPRLHLRYALGLAPQVAALRRLIRARDIDLVVIGGLVNPHAAIAAQLAGVPIVWQIVDSRAPTSLRALSMAIVTRLADVLMFTGHALVDLHVGRRRLAVPQMVYYPPVDTSRFAPSAERRRATRQALHIPESAMVVGTVANLNPQKGIEYFIRAAARIYRSQADCWFLVVGAQHQTHGEYAAQLEMECRHSGVPRERFIFTGGRADVENFYPAMDVKLITSVPRSEGTATTAMEAMANGLPVVTTRVGAISEVVEDGRTGFVVPAGDADAIAAATVILLQHPKLRAGMGAEARRQAAARYDVEVCADIHVDAFEAAIAHHRTRKRRRAEQGTNP